MNERKGERWGRGCFYSKELLFNNYISPSTESAFYSLMPKHFLSIPSIIIAVKPHICVSQHSA